MKSVISQLKPQRHREAPTNKPSDKLADPARIGVLSDEPERRASLSASASRCQFTFADGRQCKTPSAQLCAHHASRKPGKSGAKRASDASALEPLCADLTTATSINRALAQTVLLMAQGRISRKDAVAFGYLSQLLLQSVSGVRAEYVAAKGYRQWENKLKTSVSPDADDDPDPSSGGDSGPSGGGGENLEQRRNGVVERQKGMSIRPLLPHKEDERGIPPKPLPVNKAQRERRNPPNPPQERPLAERIMGKPDYADILSRSLDLFDRKYDFTPEGRSEANKLALELELMKPAPAKPAKDFFGQTVALMRRFRDAENNATDGPEPSSLPPEAFLSYDGHPIKPAFRYEADTATPSNSSPSRAESPAPDPATCSSAPVAAAVRDSQRAGQPSASDPAAFVAPPSRRHRKPRQRTAPQPSSFPEGPASFAVFAAPEPGPHEERREGHRTDWYAPQSWSKTRPPDPFPSRKEKLRRKIHGLANSAFRRLQHQNSRGFSTKGLQKLIP